MDFAPMLPVLLALQLQESPPATAPAHEPELVLEPVAFAEGPAGESVFPSWLVTDGAPELVVLRPRGAAGASLERRPLADETARATELASGTDWLVNWADFPAAARLGDGTVLAVWLALDDAQPHSYGTRFALRVPRASVLGAPVPRPLEEHRGAGEHGFVSLAPLDDERFLALWLDGRAEQAHGSGETRLYARTVARGGALGPETLVDPRTCSCCPTTLVRLADGTHLAAWRDRSQQELRDIALARFDGERWSAPESLHADGWKIEGCPVNGPRLAASRESVAATWYTGADCSVRASFADARGRRFGAPVRVDDGAPEGRGDAAFLPDGSLLVGWMEHEPERSSWRVRRVSRDGKLGPSLVVTRVSSERASGFLRMTSDGAGVLVAYTETDPARSVAVRRVRLAESR